MKTSTGTAPRMSDVAAAAGVSLVTVSRVINEPERVRPQTLRSVRDAIERLGYVPNLMAGSLASNRSRIVGAIVPTISNLVFAETIDALTQALAEGGYQLLLGQSSYRDQSEEALIEAFLGRRVDGLVLTGSEQSAVLSKKLRRAGLPVVQTWDLGLDAIDMQVGFSNLEAGRAAAEHLIARGHRALAFLGAHESRSRQRLAGLREIASAAGVRVVADLMRAPANVDEAAPRMRQLILQHPDVTAIFCNNDLLAAGVLFECQRNGWNVPSKMAVLGFGDLAIARAASPRLSTIMIRRREIGARAGELLLSRMIGEAVDTPTVNIGFEVLARETT